MADESKDKVTVELDLDTKEFEVKINGVTQTFKKVGESGEQSFHKWAMEIFGVNQAISLGKEALHAFEYAVQQISLSEKIGNQKIALKNLTESIGADAEKIKDAIIKTTHGTVNSLQANNIAFQLLNSGIKAEFIPTIVEWAHKVEQASGGAKSLESAIQAISMAVESGQSRGLKQFGIDLDVTGNRQVVLNSILKQTEVQLERLGVGYTSFGEKLETKLNSAFAKTKKGFADIFQQGALLVLGDDVDKAADKLSKLENKLKAINDSIKSQGEESKSLFQLEENGEVKNATFKEQRLAIEKRIKETKDQLIDAEKKSRNEIEETGKSLTQTSTVVKSLTDDEKKRAELSANVLALSKLAAVEQRENGLVEIQTSEQIFAAKKMQIEYDFQNRKAVATSTAHNEKELQTELIRLEQEKHEKIRALKMNEAEFDKALRQAQINLINGDILSEENAQQKHQDNLFKMEEARYLKEQQMTKVSGLEKEELNRKLENDERTHQQNIANIKSQYESFNNKNFQFGLNQSLTQMRSQFGSFTNFVASATTKTHSIMSKGFVDLAKGHGDAMQKMLGQFLEMIGTQMIESGTYHLLNGIASFNASEVGAGTGLIAAGSALVGASVAVSPPSEGDKESGYDKTTTNKPPERPTPGAATQDQLERKQAQIIINGDFLNSRETANHLSEILRQNSDITDYTITAQGRNYA